MKLLKNWPLLFSIWLIAACNPAADTPETARNYLLAAPDWGIKAVYINEALSFKDGKQLPDFGGPVFNRYMKSVQFREDGAFVGKYEDKEKPNVLHWEIDPANKVILVTAADTTTDARSGWTIQPSNVHEDYFEMTTETAAFDYPRVTRIRLAFERK